MTFSGIFLSIWARALRVPSAILQKLNQLRWYRAYHGRFRYLNYAISTALILGYYYILPRPLFNEPLCVVLEDTQQNLLGARIAKDGQWRFPECDSLPEKYEQCLIQFEDRRFYYHPGFDPISMGRAILSNFKNKRVVSGASTLSMQTIRLSRNNPKRTVLEKMIELVLVTRLELGYSKKDILNLYASHAPFGGNVVGLEAASWRYFGKHPSLLSWAEAALMAVLPNNPSLVHPGRNREQLLLKRNRLLEKMRSNQIINAETFELAQSEPLPENPLALPQATPHLLDRISSEQFDTETRITKQIVSIDRKLQENVSEILLRHHQHLKGNGIHNAAALVLEIETGKVLAYVGNIAGAGMEHGEQVDIINSVRGSGSIFKPLLMAQMLQQGQISPQSIISDVPTNIYGYEPENYFSSYDGVVSVQRALARSLNVPFIKLLQEYGLEKFHHDLQKMGINSLKFPAVHYGLPLILGGAETSLWDITNVYAKMARTLNHFYTYDNQYDVNDWRNATFYAAPPVPGHDKHLTKEPHTVGAGAIWLTFDAMTQIERPDQYGNWDLYQHSKKVAWKTGTSFGFRDAWSIGVNPKYAVGVWVGNADGEGRPGLIGVEAAAPILFDIFDLLPGNPWFDMPANDLQETEICQNSGYRYLDYCPKEKHWTTKGVSKMKACPYHQMIHLDSSKQYRVTDRCVQPFQMVNEPWFILPPVEEYYHRAKNPNYRILPRFLDGCEIVNQQETPLQLIYPRQNSSIYVPIGLDGKPGESVFKATHKDSKGVIHWNLDATYIGTTEVFHELLLRPNPGKHRLTLVDQQGNRIEQDFEVVKK